ncbi:MAG: hypothetical protein JRF47_18585 [Deltaproteobacteria bacterium]|nr:hypothetical protein [Deltaproteobacteria bacterium]
MSEDHHHHHHEHDSHGELSFDEKIEKMLSHWIKHNEDHASNYRNWAEKAKANGKADKHNEDHASNYRNWAEKAKANGKADVGVLLEEAADMSLAINDKFEAALALISDK